MALLVCASADVRAQTGAQSPPVPPGGALPIPPASADSGVRAAGMNAAPASSGTRKLSNDAVHASAPIVTAAPIARSISLDGRLDDDDWGAAIPATGFRQSEPIDGAPASERTEVRILYDAQAIYVGARLYDKSGKPSSRLGRRDADLSDSDWFIVVFDSYHDHSGGYRFKVNPSGVFGDEANGDRSWNPVWDVATTIDRDGWTVEMRIPFSQLRFSTDDDQVWGVQFLREIRSKAEKVAFSYAPRRDRGGPSRFGHLVGLEHIKRGKALEVLPYVTGSAEYKAVPMSAAATFVNPFRDGSDYKSQTGADVKYRVTSNFTLDATFNPDFGQIEADEAQVNLSANELYLREQRPFFIEGSNVFRFGTGVGGGGMQGGGAAQILYSRRVGRSPQGSVPSSSLYADMPSASTILGAAKLTGRTASGWSLGVMEAVTGREVAPWVDASGSRHASEVEPRTNYLAARARRDLREGMSTLGVIATSVHRDLGDSSLATRLRSSAYVAGVDFGHLFGGRTWEVSGSMLGSHIAGSTATITAAQRSSARFYNRPDATYLEVDSAATALSGWSGALGLSKNNGQHWTGNVRVNAVSPGYEINDLGFQNSADRVTVNAGVNYDEIVIGKHLRRWGGGIRPEFRTNFGGDVIGRALRGDLDAQLLNFVSGRLNFSQEFSSLDDRLTRGGPLALTVPATNLSVNVSSDPRKAYTWNLSAGEKWDASGGWGQSRQVRFGFRPASWWSGEVAPNFSRGRNTAQYVTRIVDASATETFGRRYIFAEIEQTTVSMMTRLNVTMSPRLTFAFAAEPFIASGAYGAPMQLRTPRTYDFSRYGVDIGTMSRNDSTKRYTVDPDGTGPAAAFTLADNSFNTRSMNATGNVRWDWRPGSTMFVVWQHRRSNPANFGSFDLQRDVRQLFGQRSDNTLQFKMSFWMNP